MGAFAVGEKGRKRFIAQKNGANMKLRKGETCER